MDDDKIIELYLSRDESAIRETAARFGARLRAIALFKELVGDFPGITYKTLSEEVSGIDY